MDSREQHINHAYHLRRECCRNGCRRVATNRIDFFGYRFDKERGFDKERDSTYACPDHAKWWTTGINGMMLGTRVRI